MLNKYFPNLSSAQALAPPSARYARGIISELEFRLKGKPVVNKHYYQTYVSLMIRIYHHFHAVLTHSTGCATHCMINTLLGQLGLEGITE